MKRGEPKIDLNCDMGEVPEAIADGTQEALMRSITSVNIACGGHAGDEQTMKTTIEQALRWKLAIGAHPGYPDRANFGRLELKLPKQAIADSVFEQVRALAEIAAGCGARVVHVKPHGALYNMAVRDAELADVIARAIASVDAQLILFAPDSGELARAGEAHELQIAREVFADRNYLNDGWLVPRTRPDALLHGPKKAAQRVLRMLREGKVRSVEGRDVDVRGETICVHGDTPGAVEFARELRTQLESEGVRIRAPQSSL